MSPFNHPEEFAQTAAMVSATLRDHRPDAALAQSLTMQVGIVATIGVDALGLPKRPAAHATNRRDRIDERQQPGDVVSVRAGHDRADGTAVCVDEDVVLGTGSRTIRGVRASFSAAPTARTAEESIARTRGRSGQPRAACRAAVRATGPTHQPSASRAVVASRLRRSQSPIWSAGGSIAHLSSARTRCHSAPPEPIRVGDQDVSCAVACAAAVTVRSVSTARHQ